MKRTRTPYTAKQKVTLLRRHLIEKVPISEVCAEAKLQPTVFYRWLKQFFENGAAALERTDGTVSAGPDRKTQRRIAQLEARLQQKNEVLAELLEEHVALKKSLGER